jgi:hypothetical protein
MPSDLELARLPGDAMQMEAAPKPKKGDVMKE